MSGAACGTGPASATRSRRLARSTSRLVSNRLDPFASNVSGHLSSQLRFCYYIVRRKPRPDTTSGAKQKENTMNRRTYRRIHRLEDLKLGSRYRCNPTVATSDDWRGTKANQLVDVVEIRRGRHAALAVHTIDRTTNSYTTETVVVNNVSLPGLRLWTATGKPPLPGQGPNKGRKLSKRAVPTQRDQMERKRVTRKVGQHHRMEALVRLATQRDVDGYVKPIYLPGPSGTGKTFAARALAKGLGADFDVIGTLADRYELTGFTDANGNTTQTTFRRIWENGGVLLLDELDRSNPDATIWLNPPLDNNIAPFPGGLVERHKDCIIIATGNTRLTGPTARYTTAQRHDSAFAERFFFLDWELDLELEAFLARGNTAWLKRVRAIREAMGSMGGDFATFAPDSRAVNDGVVLLANGWSVSDVEDMTALKLLDVDGKAAVRAEVRSAVVSSKAGA